MIKKKLCYFKKSLAFKMILILIVFIIVPMYFMFKYIKLNLELYVKEELSNKIIQTISKSEEEIYSIFTKMAMISTFISVDEDLQKALSDKSISYYEKAIIFEKILKSIKINNFLDINNTNITLIDTDNNIYANWELNFNDYSFLLENEMVKKSIEKKGHIIWGMFTKTFIKNEKSNEKYISLTRAIPINTMKDSLPVIIISLKQIEISQALIKYSFEKNDMIYICTDENEIMLKYDNSGIVSDKVIYELNNVFANNKSGNKVETISNKKYLVSYYSIDEPWTIDGKKLKVYHFTNYDNIFNSFKTLSNKINIYMTFFTIFIICLIILITLKIVKPIKNLSKQMIDYSITESTIFFDFNRTDEIADLNNSFFEMSEKIKEMFLKLKIENEIKEKYYYESLRAQLNPHFLFNTLNSIRWMAIIRKANNISDSVEALATMLKYSMNRDSEMVTIQEELNNIKSYIFIQNCRYGDMYEVIIKFEEDILKLKLIKFILQPIVENVIIHGFKDSNRKGRIKIWGNINDDNLEIYVEDDGKGISEEKLKELIINIEKPYNEKNFTGIGLSNVNTRIKIEYGDEYGLAIKNCDIAGTCVIYKLPILF